MRRLTATVPTADIYITTPRSVLLDNCSTTTTNKYYQQLEFEVIKQTVEAEPSGINQIGEVTQLVKPYHDILSQ